MTTCFILSADKQPQACTPAEWVAWVESGVRRKVETIMEGEHIVTEFCGWLRNDQDTLWRTTVYGMRCAGMKDGANTAAEARAAHARMCARVRHELGTQGDGRCVSCSPPSHLAFDREQCSIREIAPSVPIRVDSSRP